jgi:hypothetical protein
LDVLAHRKILMAATLVPAADPVNMLSMAEPIKKR